MIQPVQMQAVSRRMIYQMKEKKMMMTTYPTPERQHCRGNRGRQGLPLQIINYKPWREVLRNRNISQFRIDRNWQLN